jgi:hypothetical protein
MIIEVSGILGSQRLTASELEARLREDGFNGRIVGRKPNALTVELHGEFAGAYGMKSNCTVTDLA